MSVVVGRTDKHPKKSILHPFPRFTGNIIGESGKIIRAGGWAVLL